MNGTQYDVGFGGMHGQQLYQDLADFLKEFAQFAWANALQTEDGMELLFPSMKKGLLQNHLQQPLRICLFKFSLQSPQDC